MTIGRCDEWMIDRGFDACVVAVRLAKIFVLGELVVWMDAQTNVGSRWKVN